MDIKQEVEDIVSDYIDDKEEAQGISDHILHYVWKYSRQAFAWGVIAGMVFELLLIILFKK